MNFIVYLHWPISTLSGGVTVQLNLAKALNDRGIHTKILSPHGNVENTIYNNFATTGDVNDDTIAIYCEGIEGNPLNAKKVVRWILYGAWNSDIRTFSNDEILYYFLPFCKLNNPINRLTFMYLNPGAYNKGLYRYRESCYTMKKGGYFSKNFSGARKFGQLKKPQLIRSLRNISSNESYYIDFLKSQEEYIEVFNTTKFFFCYDPACFLVFIALMCGCVVIQDPMAGYTEEEWLRTCIGSNTRVRGLAYSIENLPYAVGTIHEAPAQVKQMIESSNRSIDTFIQQMKDKTYSTDKCYNFDDSPYSFQHSYFKNKIMNNNVGLS
jgi:hypothetical protein